MPIKDLLLEASSFQSAGSMADYIGVSFVSVYHWILQYFSMSFQEFRRKYICKKSSRGSCYHLDLGRSTYSRNDYVVKKIKAKRYCACLNALEQDLIMTNAPVSVMQSVLRGSPRIEKISDDLFALVPDPLRFVGLSPLYWDLCAEAPKVAAPRVRVSHAGELKFYEKVLCALHKLGGLASVDSIREIIVTREGDHPRANNTRRVVYQYTDYFQFGDGDDQSLKLTDRGLELAKALTQKEQSRGDQPILEEDDDLNKSKQPVL